MNENPRPGLFEELKRRKVFRVAAAYVATAFIILQGADLLATGLALPAWVFGTLTVLAIVGFPLAVVLAWAYELTPEGVRRTEASAGARAVRPSRLRLAGAGAVAVVTLVAGGWWASRSLFAGDEGLRALAVLPFENITTDDAEVHFANGMRAEIMSQLSKISELRLMSPASVAAVAESPDRLGRLVAELGVGSVVEGSVRVVDGRARVTVQLTDARNGRTLWSEQYDRELADVLAVQADVALRIARALHARLTPEERQRVETLPTRDAAAYDFYLRGREVWGSSRDQLVAASELFRQATRLDPDFAMAHARLAFTWNRRAAYGEPLAIDSALAAVARAIAADSTLAFAYHTLGAIRYTQGQLGEARRAYARSLALDPNLTGSMNDIGLTLVLLGRYDESLHWAEEALSRGPNLANNYYHTGASLLLLGDDAATERFLHEGLTKSPEGLARVQMMLGYLEAFTGRGEQALDRVRAESARAPSNFEVRLGYSEIAQFVRAPEADSLVEALFHGHADAEGWLLAHTVRTRYAGVLLARGETERAQRLLAQALEKALGWVRDGHEVPHVHIELAGIYALRGDRQAALESVQRAYDGGYREYHSLRLNPLLEAIRDEAEFRVVLERIEADVARMRQRAAAASKLL